MSMSMSMFEACTVRSVACMWQVHVLPLGMLSTAAHLQLLAVASPLLRLVSLWLMTQASHVPKLDCSAVQEL